MLHVSSQLTNIIGQGIVGYTTGAEPKPRNGETKGWALGAGNELQFDGAGIQACPGAIDGGWRIWLAGLTNPGFSENCTGIVGAALKTEDPISCTYTQE
jgi:hypothetical protein